MNIAIVPDKELRHAKRRLAALLAEEAGCESMRADEMETATDLPPQHRSPMN